jgi:hypothetical protein
VVREPLDLLAEPAGVEPLDRLGDPRMQRLAPLGDDAPVDDIVREGVPECVLDVGKSCVS